MTVDNRGLNAFLLVARLGSVGAAANALSLTQPAISRTLRKFEQQLGVQLFVRHSTGMELTTFGRALLPHASLLEAGLQRALEEIDLLKGASKGLARVGILPSLVPDHLPPVLNSVRARFPGIQLHMVEAPNHQLTRALLRGEIDFAIAAVSPDIAEERISVSALVDDEVGIVVRAQHPILAKNPLTHAHLCEYDWALQERGGPIWRDFRRLFADTNLELPAVMLTANTIQTLKSVIMATDLVTMLPRISIRNEVAANVLRLVPLPNALWRRRLAVLRRPNTPLLPASSLVLAEFRKSFVEQADRAN